MKAGQGNGMKVKQVVVETPRGSRNKYKFDEKSGRIMLSKVLPQGMIFPYDFGYFPGTRSEDGDPMDVLVLHDEPTFPGCQIECRLVGVIEALQKENGEEKRNDRVVAVAQASVLFGGVEELSDMEPAVVKQIDDFFVNYQKVREIEFKVLGHGGAESAREQVERAADANRAGNR